MCDTFITETSFHIDRLLSETTQFKSVSVRNVNKIDFRQRNLRDFSEFD